MPLPKPYPPSPITYAHWNDLVDHYAGKAGTKIVSADGKGDYAEIQDAVDWVRGQGYSKGCIIVRGGVGDYVLDDTIDVDEIKEFSLLGMGMPTIRLPDDFNKNVLELDGTGEEIYTHVTVAGIRIEGNRLNQSKGGGILLENLGQSWITNCVLRDIHDFLLKITSTAGAVKVLDNFFLGSYGYLLEVESTDNEIAGNYFGYTDLDGVYIHGANNRVVNNHCWAARDGIRVEADQSIILNNKVERVNRHGINVYRSVYCSIVGNSCQYNGQGGEGDGIHLEGAADRYCERNTVTGNNCFGNQGYGVREAEYTMRNVVLANSCWNNTLGATSFWDGASREDWTQRAFNSPDEEALPLEALASDLLPAEDLTFDLGSPSKQFYYGYIYWLINSGYAQFTYIKSNLTPQAGTFDLGESSYRWRDLWLGRHCYLGRVESLPTASAEYRGALVRVEGGEGEADHLYLCVKNAQEGYEWVMIQ